MKESKALAGCKVMRLFALVVALVVGISFGKTAKADTLHFELESSVSHFSFDLDRQPQGVTGIDGFPLSFNVANVTVTNIDTSSTFVVPFLAFGGLDDAGGGFAGSTTNNFAGNIFSFFGLLLFSGDPTSPLSVIAVRAPIIDARVRRFPAVLRPVLTS